MKICIVSESHDRADALAQAVREAKAQGAEAVIHCGDLIGAHTVKPAIALGLPLLHRISVRPEIKTVDDVEASGPPHRRGLRVAANLTGERMRPSASHLAGLFDTAVIVRSVLSLFGRPPYA